MYKLTAVLLGIVLFIAMSASLGVAQALKCTGAACGDVASTRVGTGMQFQNLGKKSVTITISVAVGLPNGCSDPHPYSLAPGDKHIIKGVICAPYLASYNQ